MPPQQLHVLVRSEDDSFWATVEEFPGVFAAGDTLDELQESLAEGIALVLANASGEVPGISIADWHLEQPPNATATAALVGV
ncbi:type II toxin-antitoxin system HicB family antitoxin [Conexibacter sp. DBS9H8]|uniref:type II toxin-antitoxin system HicB family antitoxin n=1 Tax=Conexibacter sp. DBS9H8 TaxID=2937801 RepID=UPI00200C2BCB|nr:type II toxin-antitoxin system HicB family antitoxin [Conexibacter sp. DBS9H8]